MSAQAVKGMSMVKGLEATTGTQPSNPTKLDLLDAQLSIYRKIVDRPQRVELSEVLHTRPGDLILENATLPSAELFMAHDAQGNPVLAIMHEAGVGSNYRIVTASRSWVSSEDFSLERLVELHQLDSFRKWIKHAPLTEIFLKYNLLWSNVQQTLEARLKDQGTELPLIRKWHLPELQQISDRLSLMLAVKLALDRECDGIESPDWYGEICEINSGIYKRFESEIKKASKECPEKLRSALIKASDDFRDIFLGDNSSFIDILLIRPWIFQLVIGRADLEVSIKNILNNASNIEDSIIKLYLIEALAK